jgi:two-component system, chemotaxis family, sensor kinase CheA
MDEIIRDFLAEASESMDALDRSLVRLEDRPDDPELLSEIFRVMHTIKGTCGFLGLQRLALVAHAAEDVLGQFRDGVLTPSQANVSVILEAIDAIKALLSALEHDGKEPAGDDRALVTRLRQIAEDAPSTASPQASSDVEQSPEALGVRLGGVSSIDCAVEIALARTKKHAAGLRFCGTRCGQRAKMHQRPRSPPRSQSLALAGVKIWMRFSPAWRTPSPSLASTRHPLAN